MVSVKAKRAADCQTLFRKGVTRYVANRREADGIERIDATGRTDRNGVIFEITQEFNLIHQCRGRFFIFQSPLLFRPINLAKIIDASVGQRLGLALRS